MTNLIISVPEGSHPEPESIHTNPEPESKSGKYFIKNK